MGCQASMEDKQSESTEALRSDQIILVRATWNVLAEDMEDTGILILTRLMENERMLRPLFLRLSVKPGAPPTQLRLIDKHKLRRHGRLVMEALGAAVESLDDMSYLSGVLYALGQTHANYNVKPEMLPKLWPAINYGLGIRLQESYTAEVRDAWRCIFRFLISQMIIGMNEYNEALAEEQQKKERQKTME